MLEDILVFGQIFRYLTNQAILLWIKPAIALHVGEHDTHVWQVIHYHVEETRDELASTPS